MKFLHESLKKIKEVYVNIGLNKIRLENSKKNAQKMYKERNGNENITILSPNCIAGEIYNLLGLKFNSPTINCSIKRLDFIEFCCKLEQYLNIKPVISGHSAGHPILTLEGSGLKRIDIKFVHDVDDNVVLDNWEKRKKRISMDNLYIICDNKGITGEAIDNKELERINNVKSKKTIIFVTEKNPVKNTFVITNKQIKKYNYKKLNGLYGFQDFFDYVSFLAN